MKNGVHKSRILQYGIILSWLLVIANGCMKKIVDFELEFIKEGDIPGLSSASGIEIEGDTMYIVGDDTPWLFLLNNEMAITERIRISPDAETVDGRIIKQEKRDYEALTFASLNGNRELFAFGSGSLPEKRDFMYRWPGAGAGREYDLHNLYERLRQILHDKGAEMNLEAAAFWNNQLLLFNRGGNILFLFDSYELYQYLEDGKNIPNPEVRQYKLPEINGIEAGFSGAQLLAGTDLVVFTATIEDTEDWYQDGEILGSFIGILDLNDQQSKELVCKQVMKGDKPYPGKLESIVIKEEKGDQLTAVVVRDNDDGTSSFVEMRLFFKR
ncbi:hypothetical protein C900_03536 [Fulvivirga imtechensis AK7]|uniref:Phytase-like domain-containing protein n=1 Tax=Fulvivirga imtechensis AK7 TaxID=1237149 RepID=L8JNY8_9BACT|nr:hypothetical protein [Fulvivirga imtechensis]ELR70555.1 hypothetical protein C900_03536 [Fulvivirga imtechensis AK7]